MNLLSLCSVLDKNCVCRSNSGEVEELTGPAGGFGLEYAIATPRLVGVCDRRALGALSESKTANDKRRTSGWDARLVCTMSLFALYMSVHCAWGICVRKTPK